MLGRKGSGGVAAKAKVKLISVLEDRGGVQNQQNKTNVLNPPTLLIILSSIVLCFHLKQCMEIKAISTRYC